MRPIHQDELTEYVSQFQTLCGGQLQKVLTSSNSLILGIHKEKKTHWLHFVLNPRAPLILLTIDFLPKIKRTTKPIALFLKSNLEGALLNSVTQNQKIGRVIDFNFGDRGKIEFRLFPHGQNILVQAGAKSISWNKVKDLPPPLNKIVPSENLRTLDELYMEWESGQSKKPQKKTDPKAKQLRAIKNIEVEIERKENLKWTEFAEWLKQNLDSEIPKEYMDYVDENLTPVENLERAYQKAKDTKRKIEVAKNRLQELKSNDLTPQKKQQESLFEASKSKGRKKLIQNSLEIYVGKSAKDNLNLLRRAKPWDYWFHLRDFPGAHAILRRPRGYEVGESELREACEFLIQNSAKKLVGERVDVVLVECRFVRPIKGDKLGRVNYHSERVLSLRV